MIPRSIAYRTWAAVLEREARRLRSLADPAAIDHALRRRGAAAAAAAIAMADRRRAMADELDRRAAILADWIRSGGPAGGDLEASIVGLVSGYLHDHTPSTAALYRWAEARGRTGGPPARECIALIRWILETR